MNDAIKWAKLQDIISFLDSMIERQASGCLFASRQKNERKIVFRIQSVNADASTGDWRLGKRHDFDISMEESLERIAYILTRITIDFLHRIRNKSQLRSKEGSFVSPKNELKPFLTPKQELGMD